MLLFACIPRRESAPAKKPIGETVPRTKKGEREIEIKLVDSGADIALL